MPFAIKKIYDFYNYILKRVINYYILNLKESNFPNVLPGAYIGIIKKVRIHMFCRERISALSKKVRIQMFKKHAGDSTDNKI